MKLYKRIFMGIIRRPLRAMILALMILSLSILSMVGVFLQDLIKNVYEEYVKLDGYSIAIENSEEIILPNILNNKILGLDHMIGYNNNGNMHGDYEPVNFINIPYENNEDEQGESSVDITLYANMNTSLYSTFRNGEMVLIDGVYPDNNNKGVLVDEMLANKNGLSIGENIELHSTENDKTVPFEIIGIYKTLEPPKVGVSNSLGTYYKVSDNSYIFCDYDSFFNISDRSSTINSLIYYVDEYDHIELAYNQIKEIVSPEGYIVINCLESTLSYYGQVIFTLKNTTTNLLGFTYVTSIFILFLMTLLWMRSHYYEAGIYIALGMEKRKIVLYFMLEIMSIAISTLIVAFVIGRSILYTNQDKLLKLALGYTNSSILDKSLEAKFMEYTVSFQPLLYACGIYLVVVIIATLLSSTIITMYNPRKLFDQQ